MFQHCEMLECHCASTFLLPSFVGTCLNSPNRLGGRVYNIYILALCCIFFSHFKVYIKPPYFAYISHSIYNTEVQGESLIAATGWWERRRDSDDSDDDGRTKRMQKAEADLIAKRPRQVWVWKLRSQIHQPNLLPFDPHGTYGTLQNYGV
jgi:hypothetical protein